MDTKALDKIQSLRRNAKEFGTFWERYGARIADPNVDKFGAAFNSDDRYRAFSLYVGFDSKTGIFGNSSCSSFMACTPEIACEYFVKALNFNSEAIFATMAKLMAADAAKLTVEAQKEISRLQELVAAAVADEAA